MKKQILFMALIFLSLSFLAGLSPSEQHGVSSNNDIIKIAKKISSNGWIYIKENFEIDPLRFFSIYKKEFKLSEDDEIRLQKEGSDSIYKFYKFNRYYKGIPIEGAGYTLKFQNNNLELVIGKIIDLINIDIKNVINPETALKVALERSGATIFGWQDKNWESFIKEEKKDSTATWFPESKLVITKTKDNQFKLAYAFNILSTQPKLNHSIIYIDAKSANFIKEKSLIHNSISTGTTCYNGNKTFVTYFVQGLPGKYTLQDRTRGMITIKWCSMPDDWNSTSIPYSYDSYFTDVSEWPMVSALWAAEETYDYFYEEYGISGTDGNNKTLNICANWDSVGGRYYSGSSENEDFISIGYVSGVSYASVEKIGHEYMHAVTKNYAGLANVSDESSAIDESLSDFFGECIDYYVTGLAPDWLVGTDVGTTFKSFQSPNQYNQPDYYHGTYWYSGADWNIYGKTNSGVLNRAFYLLSNGDSQVGINGIGIDNTANYAISSLIWYLDEDATFNELREAFLNWALNDGDECSTRYKEIMNAFAAVGIGDPAPNPCTLPFTVSQILEPYGNPNHCCDLSTFYVNVSGGSGNYDYFWFMNGQGVSVDWNWNYYVPCDTTFDAYIEYYVNDGSSYAYRDKYVTFVCGELLSQSDQISLTVFPNPTTGLTTVQIKENPENEMEDQLYTILIIDRTGRRFLNTTTKSKKIDINMQGYQKGSYSLIVTNGKNQKITQIVKN